MGARPSDPRSALGPGPRSLHADPAAPTHPPPEASDGSGSSGRRVGAVGWGFISLYTLSFAGGALVLIAPLLVTLALKVSDLVGIDDAPKNLALVTGVGSLLAMVDQPVVRPTQRPHHRPDGDATPVDARRTRRRHARHPRRSRPRRPSRRPRRLVHRPGLLQRAAGRTERRAARPGARSATRRRVGDPRRLHAGCVGGRHLPGAGVRRTRARHVPGAVRGRRRSRRRVRARAQRPTARPTTTGRRWSLRELAGSFYVNPRRQPGLRVGVRQPVHAA